MNYILFDDISRYNLLPLTFTRPVSEIRLGITTLTQKWNLFLDTTTSFLTSDYLSMKYRCVVEEDNILINGSVVPTKELIDIILALHPGEILMNYDIQLAVRLNSDQLRDFKAGNVTSFKIIMTNLPFEKINYPWDIFQMNEKAIREDFKLITNGRKSAIISNTNRVIGTENVFAEEGSTVECAILNGSTGPIYIGKDAEIMEGAMIRGPFAMCEHASVKMGAKIYGATTVGPYCKVGGEISNSILFGYSNKAHDGFLGSSVIGEWCNFGADTNNSNLKNNYTEVKVWNYPKEIFMNTGLQFCGLIMGDHSKTGINTMFNTGTVVGVSSNIFGSGFPRNFIPSFAFGGSHGFTVYNLEKTFEVASIVMNRRKMEFTATDKEIFRNIFNLTEKFRKF